MMLDPSKTTTETSLENGACKNMTINIYYMQGTRTIATANNVNMVPRVGEKVNVYGQTLKVKDVIWHLCNPMWVEVQIDF